MTNDLQQRATDEQINRAIHEQVMGLCWHESEAVGSIRDGGYYCRKCGSPDKLRRVPLEFENGGRTDYTTDLNAVDLAEAKVDVDEYVKQLEKICEAQALVEEQGIISWGDVLYLLVRATARQRSEAVLKCMEIEL